MFLLTDPLGSVFFWILYMNVYISFVAFAIDGNEVYVLLYKNKLIRQRLSEDDKNSFSVVETMLYNSMGITGRWLESSPKLIGVLDEIDRKESSGERMVDLVYAVYMPATNSTKPGYTWHKFFDIDDVISDPDNSIIRYAANVSYF